MTDLIRTTAVELSELLATGDPRAIETAQLIHERFLAGPDGEA